VSGLEQGRVGQLRKFQIRKFMLMKNYMLTYEKPIRERIKTAISVIMRGINKENTST